MSEMVDEQENARGAQTHAHIQIPPGPRLGNVVLEVEGLEKAYGDKLLFKDLTFKLPPNGIVGVIGPNGAGKSTLFKLITGQEKPDGGTIRLGETVKLAYVDQSRDDLDAGQDHLAGDLRRPRRDDGRQARDQHPRLCRLLQLQGRRPAEEGRPAVRR